jgi:methyl-accepting chemotaxis protein
MLDKMKIRSKLMLSFILVAAIAGAIGLYSIRNLKIMEEADTALYETVAIPLGYATEMAALSQELRVNLLFAAASDSLELSMAFLQNNVTVMENFEKVMEKYEGTIIDETDRMLWEKFGASVRKYSSESVKIRPLLRKNQRAEVLAYLQGDMTLLKDEMVENREALINYMIESGKSISDGNTQIANATTRLMTIIIIFAVLISVLLGLFISRNIQKIILSVVSQTRQLADAAVGGKLDTRANIMETNVEFREITKGINNTLDAVINPLNVAAEYIDRISKGDIPPKITDNYNGDFNEIKNNLNQCIEAVDQLVQDANSLSTAAIEGRLNTRVKADRHQGDFKVVVNGVNKTLDVLVGLLDNMPAPAMIIDKEYNIRYMNETGASVNNKKGIDLVGTKCYDHFNTEDCKTSKCACSRTMNSGQKSLSETTARPGNLELEINYSAIPLKDENGIVIGAFEVVSDQTEVKRAMRRAEKINGYQAIEADKLTHALDMFSKGDLSFRLQTETGDNDTVDAKALFDGINHAVNSTSESVKSLIADANLLSIAAVEGKLNTRADAEKHQGDFRKIVEGVNQTLDAVIGPLNVAADYVARISVGDMPPIITDNYNGDFNMIKNNLNVLINALNEIVQKSKLVAEGDLTVDLKKRSENDELMQSLTEMVKATANIISEFQTAANNISSSSQQMSSTSQQMSQGATEQASSAEEVSSSMEEMAANIQQNTDNAQQTEKIALNAADGINKVNSAAEGTLKFMQDIAEKVSIIGEIARQTNILALNAAVEAARAGEHGKGFAVVAAEVRKLAERSQISAVEIDELTKNSVKATEESGRLLAAIAPEIGKTAKLVQEIAAASIEQNSGADQVNNAIQQLNQVTQQNAAASEEMATSSEELAGQADQLLEMISFFKLDNGKGHDQRKSYAASNVHKPGTQNGKSNGHHESAAKDFKQPKKNGSDSSKGVLINLGKDHFDSQYEKF